jgi:hypothetical protein
MQIAGRRGVSPTKKAHSRVISWVTSQETEPARVRNHKQDKSLWQGEEKEEVNKRQNQLYLLENNNN